MKSGLAQIHQGSDIKWGTRSLDQMWNVQSVNGNLTVSSPWSSLFISVCSCLFRAPISKTRQQKAVQIILFKTGSTVNMCATWFGWNMPQAEIELLLLMSAMLSECYAEASRSDLSLLAMRRLNWFVSIFCLAVRSSLTFLYLCSRLSSSTWRNFLYSSRPRWIRFARPVSSWCCFWRIRCSFAARVYITPGSYSLIESCSVKPG